MAEPYCAIEVYSGEDSIRKRIDDIAREFLIVPPLRNPNSNGHNKEIYRTKSLEDGRNFRQRIYENELSNRVVITYRDEECNIKILK